MHTEHLFRVHLYYWWALDFHVGADIAPFWISADQVTVIVLLQLDGQQLVDVVGRDPAVGRDSQDAVILGHLLGGGDLSHVLAGLGADLGAEGFLGACAFGQEAAARRSLRRVALRLLSAPSRTLLRHGTYVFQGSSHSCLFYSAW